MDYPRPCSERVGGAKEAGLEFNMQALMAFRQSDGKNSCVTAYYSVQNSHFDMGRLVFPVNDTTSRS